MIPHCMHCKLAWDERLYLTWILYVIEERIMYSLGSVVKHKKYGFRGGECLVFVLQ